MKALKIFVLINILIASGYAQNSNKSDGISFTSEQVRLSFAPARLIPNISIATSKFVDGQMGIGFYFTSKPGQRSPEIRIDSFILQTSDNQKIILNNLFGDSTYFLSEGGLSSTSILYLNKNEVEILKQVLIKNIVVIVDKKELLLNLNKKSQIEINNLINNTL